MEDSALLFNCITNGIKKKYTEPDLPCRYGSLLIGGVKSSFKKKSGSKKESFKVQSDSAKVTPAQKRPRGSFSFVGGMQVLSSSYHALRTETCWCICNVWIRLNVKVRTELSNIGQLPATYAV